MTLRSGFYLLVVLSRAATSWAFDGLHGYVAINPEVVDLANIARDLQAMQDELERFEHNEEGIGRAHKIYEFGGYSRSGCTLIIEEGLPFDMPAGSVFAGVGQGGQETKATLEIDQKEGDTEIRLLYTQENPCYVGGLPQELQQKEGCFESPGTVSFEKVTDEDTGETTRKQMDYTYSTAHGNTNERTLYSMSFNAGRKFRLNGSANEPYFPAFQKFVDYYGEPDFGNRMINAAMRGDRYSFQEGTFDFSNSSHQTRGKMMELFASYLNIGLFIISELENAVEKCDDHCHHGDCHHAAVHALDAAVAFYVGALQAEDPSGNGNLLYGLANEMCARFKTCGPNGGLTEGTAKVNHDMFVLFTEMRENLETDKCVDARRNRDSVEKLMFVPLVQGFRFATYRRLVGYTGENLVDDAPPFSAAVLPLLGHCRMKIARDIQLNFAPGNRETGEDLSEIEETLHEHYECMGMCCSDVGGLWDAQKNEYDSRADVCEETYQHCIPEPEPVVESEPNRSWMLYVFLAGLCVAISVYYKRWKEMKRRRRAAATGEYADYDDNSDSSADEDTDNVFA